MPMAGQHPGKVLPAQPAHRGRLLRPRMPARQTPRVEHPLLRVPPQVVAGEQVAAVIQQHAMARRMAGSRDDPELRQDMNRFGTFNYYFGAGLRAQVCAMNDPARTEAARENLRRRHVVAMGQEDVTDSAQLLEPAHQMADRARRIDQPVTRRMADEVAGGAIALLGVEAAV